MAVEETLAKLGIEIAFDSSGFKEGITKVNNNLRTLKSELTLSKSSMQNFGNTTESLKVKAANLSEAILNQKAKVELLNEQYKASAKAKGEDATETQKLKAQLNNATATLNNMEKELKQLNQDIKGHTAEWKKLGETLTNAGQKITAVGNGMQKVGSTLTRTVTAPIVAVGTLASKSAIEFESAFAGVKKTVEATEEQFAELELGIRNMSKELPASTTEISAVAEAAGQLGIKTEDVLSFTRVMIDLGESTNLAANEAASALAKFANVTKMSASDYGRLGSVIVALGNNFATTESDIVSMATRLAASGELAGLSQAQIMALATSMSSVGIEAEAGGSAMSKLLKKIQLATELGGQELNQFSSVAGMTANEFKKAFETDAVGALSAFIDGLNNTERNGKSAIAVLDDMGLTEVRLSNTILSLANASGVMTDAINLANESWEENTALTNEANQRYGTTESQIAILKNNITDMAIELGQALLPVIIDLVDMVKPIVERIKEWATSFKNLDEETRKSQLKLIGIVAAIGPVLSIAGKLTSSIGNVVSVFGKVSTAIGNAGGIAKIFSTAIGAITSPVGLVVIGITALIAALVHLYNTNDEFKEKVHEALEKVKNVVEKLWNTIKPIIDVVMELLAALWEAIQPLIEVIGNVLVTAVSLLADWWGFLIDAIQPVITIVTKLLSALKPIINAIGTVIGWIASFINALLNIGDTMSKIGEILSAGWENIKNWFSNGINNIKESWSNGWNNIKQKASEGWENVKNGISNAWDNVKTKTAETWENIKTSTSNAWENLKTNTSNLVNNIKTGIQDKWNELKTNTINTWNNIKDSVVSAHEWMYQHNYYYENICNFVSDKWNEIKTNTIETWENIKSNVSEKYEELKTKTTEAWDNISQKVSDTVESVKTWVSDKWNDMKNNISETWTNIKTGTAEAWNNVKNKISETATNIGNAVSNKWNELKEGTAEKFNAIKNAAAEKWRTNKK